MKNYFNPGHPLHVIEAAKAGVPVAPIPFEVIEKRVRHPLTDIGIKKFLEDWKNYESSSRTA